MKRLTGKLQVIGVSYIIVGANDKSTSIVMHGY